MKYTKIPLGNQTPKGKKREGGTLGADMMTFDYAWTQVIKE